MMIPKILLLMPILNAAAAGPGGPGKVTTSNRELSVAEVESLVPESGILFEPGGAYQYQEILLGLLLDTASTPNRECQMVVEDGFGGRNIEFAVFVERDRRGQGPTVVRRNTKKSIRAAVAEAAFDRSRPEGASLWPHLKLKASDISEHRAPLGDDTADVLDQVCQMMLGTTRYPKKPILALHPVEAHFAHHDVDHGYRAGKASSDRGRVGRFVRLIEQLGEIASVPVEGRAAVEKRLKESALGLIAELSKAGEEVPDIQRQKANRSAPLPDPPPTMAKPPRQ